MAKDAKAVIQAKARALCEVESIPQREIAARLGVTDRTIANWSERGMPLPIMGPWIKGQHSAAVQQKIEESTIEAAARRGMTKDYFLAKVQSMLDAKTRNGDVNFDVLDKGLVHAERIIPGLKADETVNHNFPAQVLAFFQDGQ